MKVVIVGGVAGGATTATRLRRLDENLEIVLFERGEHISFANCGLPYYIGDIIKTEDDLLVQTPEKFKERFNIDVRIKQEVIKIDKEKKKLQIKNKATGEVYIENYDKLVLSPGAEPINPFKGVKSDRIFTIRNVKDAEKVKTFIENNNPKSAVIVGGGYIGVEMAENLSEYTMEVSIVEKAPHLISIIDNDMAHFIHKEIKKHGVKVYVNEGVNKIEEHEKLLLTLDNGKIETDLVILCIGVRPETNLAEESGINTNEKGAIIVNNKMQTSDKDIYALGDAVEVKNTITGERNGIALAGPANRQARIVANNIHGIESSYEGFIGSSILKIFNYSLGIVGLSEIVCKNLDIPYKSMIISPYSHATYYPGAKMLTIKAIYNSKTSQILGAYVWGKSSVDKITDILSVAIQNKMGAADISALELCYAPPYSSAKSPVNILGNAIENEMNELVDTIAVEELKNKENLYILDVRTIEEYNISHIEGAINIPLDELRENIEKLDKSKEIIVHCHSGLRSYLACRILKQKGYNVKNLIGGYIMYDIMKNK
jgi:NADPH-dependent 2,4-dienoyl-CoA reductase/sulfur reductase-like enzyme/rhodanese-related sulfurtransferase